MRFQKENMYQEETKCNRHSHVVPRVFSLDLEIEVEDFNFSRLAGKCVTSIKASKETILFVSSNYVYQ